MLEATLFFGYDKGAFTGAVQLAPGKFLAGSSVALFY